MIALQHRDGSANDRPADAEMRPDHVLGKLHARSERAFGDRFRQRVADAHDNVVAGHVAAALVHFASLAAVIVPITDSVPGHRDTARLMRSVSNFVQPKLVSNNKPVLVFSLISTIEAYF
ncbi:hypothetical protein LJR090_002884 [Bosea sp. LjRoot90]|uniref:hypothetical protein n=1 Tax=Bosea sp. LjRoot90 TaxID=3342342 RepID=UPI003ECF32B2